MKLLCVGDIHLGRQPSRLSAGLLSQLGSTPGPSAAWQRTVDYAISNQVDAVLLAGDVVEQEDDFYEAFGDLRRGVQRLTEAGIRVLGVAGNHDVRVLPRLADSVEGFRLLGRGGEWETEVIQAAGSSRQVRVLGWSFPDLQVNVSPLASRLPERCDDVTIGLLHCDRDQARSRHAPVRGADLLAAPVDAWLLGHIHKPDALASPRPIGYLGSLTGLDPGEAGPRGPWLLGIDSAGSISIDHIPLAPLCWEELEVSVDDLEDAAEVHRRVTESVGALHTGIAACAHRPDAVGCRLKLVGRTPFRLEIERILSADDPRQTPHDRDGIVYFIHDWRIETAPAIDLAELARGTDPVGLLARKIMALQGGDEEERRVLVEDARTRFAAVTSSRNLSALGSDPPDSDQAGEILLNAARRALDDLLAQREAIQ